MESSLLTLIDLENLTATHGEGWGLPHVQRVLHLIDLISVDVPHNSQALTVATYLHDWGAFPLYRQSGVDHALRSRQVAEQEILPRLDIPTEAPPIILETIERHDYRDPRPVTCHEARLLREADFLDFLGVIGMVREFAWGPNNLSVCLRRVLDRRQKIMGRFTYPQAQELAEVRLARMAQCLAWLEEESFAYL
jgi:uncharacterized protein